jgi:hypothetical protein
MKDFLRKQLERPARHALVVGQFRSITRVQQYFMCYNLGECPDVALLD